MNAAIGYADLLQGAADQAAAVAGDARQHDHRDRTERGTLVDAEDVGAGERVAGEGLGQGAGQAERQADQDRDQGLGEPQLHHDEPLAGVATAEERRDHVRHRDLEVTHGEVDRDEHGQDDEAEDGDEAGADRDQPRGGTDAQRVGQGGGGLADRRTRAHIRTIRLRRTSTMKTGPPTSAITMPTCSSAGRTTTRPMTSATTRKIPPISAE